MHAFIDTLKSHGFTFACSGPKLFDMVRDGIVFTFTVDGPHRLVRAVRYSI